MAQQRIDNNNNSNNNNNVIAGNKVASNVVSVADKNNETATTKNEKLLVLSALSQEKTTLHILLSQYERNFYERHQRKVSSLEDCRPLARQYRRFVLVKRELKMMRK